MRACVDDLVVDYYTFVEYTWSSLVSSTSRPICPVNMSTDQKPAAAPSATKQVSAQEETVTIVTTTAAASSTTATAITTTTEQVTAPITSVKSDVVVKEGETVEDDSHKVTERKGKGICDWLSFTWPIPIGLCRKSIIPDKGRRSCRILWNFRKSVSGICLL